MSWYLGVFKKYADFNGRARRKEYWMFTLFNFIVTVILLGIDSVILGSESGAGFLSGIYGLAVIVPSLAVLVRRLHDTGRSGWWVFINLIPFVGSIILLVFLVSDSAAGANEYGANPKENEIVF